MTPSKADVILIAANYDRTSSFGKGSDKAPKLIKKSLDRQIEFYDRIIKANTNKFLKIAWHDLRNLNKLSPEKMVRRVSQTYKSFPNHTFKVIIGGEHSITNGPLEAIASIEDSRRITIVQLDAHADLRYDDSDFNKKPWGKYAHCSVMRRAHELGYHLTQVGVRAFSDDELEYSIQNKGTISFFEWSKFDKKGNSIPNPKIKTIIDSIKTDKVYLTIDVDGFDSSIMPETGTPVPGGFTWEFGLELIIKLFGKRKVIGADIVEVAPNNENSRTAYNAAQLIYNTIGQYFQHK